MLFTKHIFFVTLLKGKDYFAQLFNLNKRIFAYQLLLTIPQPKR